MGYAFDSGFDPERYRKEAASFSAYIDGYKGTLTSAISEISDATSCLSYDSESKNDLLTTKVVSSNSAIIGEIKSISSNMEKYKGPINSKAKELDEEEIRLHRKRQTKNVTMLEQ